MKKTIVTTLVMLIIGIGMFAQNNDSIPSKKADRNNSEIKTLFGKGNHNGGYGAITANYSQIGSKDALSVGARGGWVINHCFTIGLAGYGFANDMYFDNISDGKSLNLAGGYGGLFFEPILLPKSPIHLSFPILIGAGGVAYLDDDYSWDDEDVDLSNHTEDADAFLIVEPGVELELNVLKFFRMSFGVTYRYTYDVNLINTSSTVLDGLSTGVSLKFGKF